MASAMASNTGDASSRISAANTLSSRFFRNRLMPVSGVSDKVSTGMPAISRTLWLIRRNEKISGTQFTAMHLSSNLKYTSLMTSEPPSGVTRYTVRMPWRATISSSSATCPSTGMRCLPSALSRPGSSALSISTQPSTRSPNQGLLLIF
ncbi:hypothetical protein D3C75_895890 [compost metagenome]